MRTSVTLLLGASVAPLPFPESPHGTEVRPGGSSPLVDANGQQWAITFMTRSLVYNVGAPDGSYLWKSVPNSNWQLIVWWNHELYGQLVEESGAGWIKRTGAAGAWEFTQQTSDPRGDPTPLPVDCVLSGWSPWSAWTVVPATPTTQETRTRTRTVVVPPSNGGAACGPLVESEFRAYVPTPVNRAPVWDGTPILFEEGIPASIDLRTRASDPDGDPLAFSIVTALNPDLVGAFSFNDFVLYYDGRDLGAEASPTKRVELDSGITISADDGR